MKTFQEMLDIKYRNYEELRSRLKKNKKRKIKGRLDVHKYNNGYKYYYVNTDSNSDKGKRTYIKKGQIQIAKRLAQQTYDDKLLKLLDERIRLMKNLKMKYKEDEIDNLYESLSPGKKELVTYIQPTWEDKLNDWKSTEYVGLEFVTNYPNIKANNGLRVRSKSEKILADKFLEYGLEFKYECPLQLENGRVYYPDFTFLSPFSYEEIYWEHFGMMDKVDYVTNFISKIKIYEQNNIFMGDNLIVTFESSKSGVDYKRVDSLIKHYLMKEK